MFCWNCKNEIREVTKIWRQETCPHCQAYLHCCLNCKFYDKFAHNECRESSSEWVNDKNTANYCEYFLPTDEKPPDKKSLSKEEANKRFTELLKKSKNKN